MGRHSQAPKLIWLLTCFLGVGLWAACSQPARENERPAATTSDTPAAVETKVKPNENRVEVAADEVRVRALRLFKEGSTKAFRTDVKSIPDAPPIPDSYSSLGATYELETDAVFSDAVIRITAPIAESVDFESVRILRLNADDMYPGGFAWVDCTVLRDRKNYSGVGEEFFPDPTKRSVSCYFDLTSGIPQGGYFTLVSANAPPRTTRVTEVQMSLDKAEISPGGDGMRYVLIVKNAGPQDVAEVNFHSTFAMDVALGDVRPEIGKCQRARYGNSDSSVVCFLGNMKKGDQTRVEFTANPGREKPALGKKFNRRWVIRGISRKGVNDEVVPSDVFSFEPLAK